MVGGSIVELKKDYIDPKINDLSQDIDAITDDLQGITKTARQMVGFIGSEAEKRWSILKKSWSDVRNLVGGSIVELKKDVINPILSDLSSLTTKFNQLVNKTIKDINADLDDLLTNIEKLKVDLVFPMKAELAALINLVNGLPSWINQSFAKHANDLIEQFIKVFAASEKTSVRFLKSLGIGAGEIITTILDTPADMVAWIQDAIADAFEEILDRVFR